MNMLLRRHHATTQDDRTGVTPEEVAGDNPVDIVEANQAEDLHGPVVEEPTEDAVDAEAERVSAEGGETTEEKRESDESPADAALEAGTREAPARGASTATWIAYAESDPQGAPFDLTERAGLRDDLANHYLGAPE